MGIVFMEVKHRTKSTLETVAPNFRCGPSPELLMQHAGVMRFSDK